MKGVTLKIAKIDFQRQYRKNPREKPGWRGGGGGKGPIIYYLPWGWGFSEKFVVSKLYFALPPLPTKKKKIHMKIVPLSSDIKILKMHPPNPSSPSFKMICASLLPSFGH